jgi:acylphosphatase
MKAQRVLFEGRVQGVGFRYTTAALAKGFDVIGTVRNLADGRVELHVQGDPDEVDDFLQAIRESVLAGHIRNEQNEMVDPRSGLRGFQIVP